MEYMQEMRLDAQLPDALFYNKYDDLWYLLSYEMNVILRKRVSIFRKIISQCRDMEFIV